MPKRKRRRQGQPSHRRGRSAAIQEGPPSEPDLIEEVAAALAGHPLDLLAMVSSLWRSLEPRRPTPWESDPEPLPLTRDELVTSLLDIELVETSALLTVIGELGGDELLRRRIRREVAARGHTLPDWLADLDAPTVARVVQLGHVLGDGENIMIEVRLAGGYSLSLVVYVDHNLGTLVKDAFLVPQPMDALVPAMRAAAGDDPDMSWSELPAADARVRIHDAAELSAITVPPFETDTWPACRPLLEWTLRLLPEGGTGYQRQEWDDDALSALADRFFASPLAEGLEGPDQRGLLDSLLWFGTDYGPGDPLRWSPVAVEMLLVDWIPRKVVADVDYLAKAPELLRAFIRYCHRERGLRAELTDETLTAVDEYEPEYQQTIRSPRPQGPAALLAAMGVLADDEPLADLELPAYEELVLGSLRRAVGGEAALDRVDTHPLPDEPFGWNNVPADIHQRVSEVLTLVDGCCNELLDRQYRTACRRFLSRAAAGDPGIFRRRGRADTAAAAVCWTIGNANELFRGDISVKDLLGHFGLKQSSIASRSQPMVRAIGAEPRGGRTIDLGSPDYLTSGRRERILQLRDGYRTMAGQPSAS